MDYEVSAFVGKYTAHKVAYIRTEMTIITINRALYLP
jgi:hypothetical protein